MHVGRRLCLLPLNCLHQDKNSKKAVGNSVVFDVVRLVATFQQGNVLENGNARWEVASA